MGTIPILSFAPDLDPTTPGIVVACDGFIPTQKGLRTAYEPITTGYGALPSACKGAVLARLVDGTTRIIAGTATNLYEVGSGAWVEVSKSVDAYQTGTGRWRFAQIGNATIAVNWYDLPQRSISSGVFSDFVGVPKAKFACATKSTSGEFLMLGATDDTAVTITGGPNSNDQNRVWWSGIGNYTTWAPSLSTEAGTLQLVDTPGPLTALKALGEYVVAYKEKAVYLGSYQGNVIQWGFRNVSDDIGALSAECVVVAGTTQYFISIDNIYRFAGDIPVAVGDPIKTWFFTDFDSERSGEVVSLFDRYRQLVYWFYPSTGSTAGVVDKWIALHIPTGRWGAGTNTVEAALESISASGTWDQLWVGLGYDTITDVVYDSSYFSVGQSYPAIFDDTHTMCSLSGGGGTNTLTLGYVGDEVAVGRLRRMTPRWMQVPTSAEAVHSHGQLLGSTFSPKAAQTMSRGRFDLNQSARWHQVSLTTVGTCEFSGIGFDLVVSGKE
jgi:hypothetical protein